MKENILFFTEHFFDYRLYDRTDGFFLSGCKLRCKDRFAEFDGNILFFNKRDMGFENIFRVFNGNRNDRAAGLCCDLEAAFFKWKHVAAKASRTFREEEDGCAIFDQVDAV